jgi:hypothetical protein
MFLAHSVSRLLFADFSWYTSTDGIFHNELKVSASAAETGLTEKSLKRCHWLSPGGVGSAWATKFCQHVCSWLVVPDDFLPLTMATRWGL